MPTPTPLPTTATRLARARRLLVVTVLGFASGLPLALTGQALQAWLSVDGVDIATLGFLSLIGLPYTFKFLWAPLMDRFELPLLGRRRGWLVLTQAALAGMLLLLAATPPKASLQVFALLAVAVAFLSASQDVAYDAYRTDLLPPAERGLGSSLNVMGYRLAMILSGGITLIWTDAAQGSGWSWPEVYRMMALLMAGTAVFSATAVPRLPPLPPLPLQPAGDAAQALAASAFARSTARQELLGFVAVAAAAAAGYAVTQGLFAPWSHRLLGPLWAGSALAPALQARWMDLAALVAGIAFTLPLATWAARVAHFETLRSGLANYFAQPGAAAFLGLIVMYKMGDAFALSLMTPFLLKSMLFSSAEVGLVYKVLGLWLTIAGALLGGVLMLRLGLWRALLAFGVLQGASNLAFWWLAVHGKGALPGLTVPAFDLGFVKLAQATPVDGGLLLAVACENLASGMGTAAFVAFLMSLCNQRFTATQFALLSAFASIGRVWVGPLAGVLAESIGWPHFFIVATVLSLPALALLVALRAPIRALDGGAA